MSKALDALNWAETKIGARYSQADRWGENVFDCSSLVYRAFHAAGVPLVHKDSGQAISTSTSEVYAAGFDLLYPSGYSVIGKSLPTSSTLLSSIGLLPGDLIFYNYGNTDRINKITHVSIYAGNDQIVHARNTQLGVRFDSYTYMNTRVCAVTRYKEDGSWQQEESGDWFYTKGDANVTGWQELQWSGGTSWFLFDGDGRMLTGWQNVNGSWYYLDPASGAMQVGWIVVDDNSYFMKQSGAMASNAAVLSQEGQRVWLLGENGIMKPDALPLVK